MGDNPFLAMAGIDPASVPVAAAPSLGSRAVRNNSPGNLKPGFNRDGSPRMIWAGQTGVDPQGFATFDSTDSGMAASRQQVLHDYNGGLRTPIQLATKYAPPGENNTAAYAAKLAGSLGIKPTDDAGLSDPGRLNTYMGQLYQNEDSPGAAAPTAPVSNPFLDMANGGSGAADAGAAVSSAGGGSNPGSPGSDPGGADLHPGGGMVRVDPPGGNPGPQEAPLISFAHGVNDAGVGLAKGITDVAGTIGAGVDKLGSATGLYQSYLRDQADATQKNLDASQYNPGGWASTLGRVGGDILATAPIGEVKALQLLSPESRMAAALARTGDAALQGGAAGALASGGHEVGEQAAIGAALGPIAAKAIDLAAKPALAGLEAATSSRLAQALRSRIGSAADDSAAAAPTSAPAGPAATADLPPLKPGQTIRTGADFDPQRPFINQPGVDEVTGAAAPDGLVVDVTGGQPAPASTVPPSAAPPGNVNAALEDAVRKAALGSRGARTGLEANTDYPAAVQQQMQSLMADGLPADQALRESDITYVGGKPALAHVTRNPADQRAMWEGAKLDTPEGQALAQQIADNNGALHGAIQQVVGDLGGVPAAGEATQGAAQSLAQASDAARARVNDLYAKARATDGDAQAAPDALAAVLNDPLNKAATTNEGASFINGMGKRFSILTDNGKVGLNADALEHLRQAAGASYQPVNGGEVNGLVGQVKGAIDQGFDQLGDAGPAYKAARAAHRDWAAAYDDPDGVAKLIARDAQGNFLNADGWRRAENFGGAGSDKGFVQTVRQLNAIGDQASVNKMKAAVVQSAYEAATGARGGNATDLLGNSPVSGKMFLDKLNAIGKPKLDALFSPEEQAHLATIGRAGIALNEAVPDTVNTSGTASALANAMAKMKDTGKAEGKLWTALRFAGPLVGNAVIPGAGGIAAGSSVNFARDLAQGLRAAAAKKATASALSDAANPVAARATARTAEARLAAALRRRSTAHAIAARTPPVVGGSHHQRRH